MDIDADDATAMAQGPARRNQTACEACRATKIRCQPSEQPGICRKCLDSKRECVSRTGPRTRRPKRSKVTPDGVVAPVVPAPPGPSSTFSIDFAVPAPSEIDDNFDIIRDTHSLAMDALFPPEEDESSFTEHSLGVPPTPPESASHQSQSIEDLGGKPQFNLNSAEGLLKAFRGMLTHYPILTLDENTTVPQLAARKPFVLLSILASASGSRTLQGHTLYDEEFRKVLGLKFVAGGERTMELLQGILIYCSWYPFHLRPKNKQVFHYIRMASDLVHDLDLDQEFPLGDPTTGEAVTELQLENIRAYLSYYYSASAFYIAWRKYKKLGTAFTSWTATCCDVLEQNTTLDADLVLTALVRLSSITNDASDAIHDHKNHTEQQSKLLLLGLETRADQVRGRIPPHIASVLPVKMTSLFIDFYIPGGSLLLLPRPAIATSLPPHPQALEASCRSLRTFLDDTRAMQPSRASSYTGVDWSRLVLAIILALRLSFPIAECPSFNIHHARQELEFEEWLNAMSAETDLAAASKKVDVLSASKVVFGVVREKFRKKMEAEERKVAAGVGCPMLDGSLDQYFPVWDPALVSGHASTVDETGVSGSRPVFHDLWATMTLGWAGESQEDANGW